MSIERVKIKKTLKCGNVIYPEGLVLSHPIPPDILKEIKAGSIAVEIIPIPKKRPVKEQEQEQGNLLEELSEEVNRESDEEQESEVEVEEVLKKKRVVRKKNK